MNTSLLAGKVGIVLGALDEKSIAWQTALALKKEGAKFVLSNTKLAIRYGGINELSNICDSKIIPADITSLEDIDFLIGESVSILGKKLDFVLHSVAMSHNIRKKNPYNSLNYDLYTKTIDISAISFHKLLQILDQKDALDNFASVIALTYLGSQRAIQTYSDMCDAKAMLESITRVFGEILGRKKNIRVNTISQSPTITSAGSSIDGFEKFFVYSNKVSPLGNATAEDCANFISMMFSDYTKKITMQNIMHDGGFSKCVISDEILEKII